MLQQKSVFTGMINGYFEVVKEMNLRDVYKCRGSYQAQDRGWATDMCERGLDCLGHNTCHCEKLWERRSHK